MDTKTIGIAVSASAFGAALAYLGYSNINNENENLDESLNDNDETSKIYNNTLTSINDVTDSVEKNTGFETQEEVEQDEKKIQTEVKEVIAKKKWGDFWKEEYNNVDKASELKPGINAEGFN